jgi:uncharacterized protein
MQLDQPLSDKEFDDLDKFLLSDSSPEDAMTMDMLHGYLTAVAIGPEPIMPAEWLPRVWGDDPKQGPKFKNAKEEERVLNLIMRFMNEILVTFEVAPKEFEPLFVEHEVDGERLIDAESWCWGFCEGMEIRPESWEEIFESEQAPLMNPIMLLGADEIEEEDLPLVEDPKNAHKLALEVEANLPLIHRFWVPRRKAPVQTLKREEPKVGRNDDCPCGSGKKYKKCCGAES